MRKFRKKPVVVEAVQFRYHHPPYPDGVVYDMMQCELRPKRLRIETLEGPHAVSDGDWIITGVKGEKYPCKPDIFAMTYEEVPSDELVALLADPAPFERLVLPVAAIPMRLPCPACGVLHVDRGEFATKPHHTHACQSCGMVWRPALVDTVGVEFLPGFKDPETP